MWELDEFDGQTRFLERDFLLPRITTDDVRRLLDLGETVEIDGHQYPLEAGGYDVPQSLVTTFASYGDVPDVPRSGMDYQVAFYPVDQQ